jgi:Family of unknown function (DUF5677)
MSDERKPSFEFGYPERQAYFFETFEPFLFGLAEFQEAFDLVIGEIGKHADDLSKRLIFCLGRMAWEDLNEMLLLCANGFHAGGLKVLRAMFEHVLYSNHFRLHPEDAERFWDYHYIDRYKLMKRILSEYPDAFPADQVLTAKNEYERLGDTFKVPVCEECRPIRCPQCNSDIECQRCKKTKDYFSWTRRDIVSMAREQEIDIINIIGMYYFPMQETHPKVISIINRLQSDPGGATCFTDEPNWAKVRDVIVGAHYLILRVLHNWSEAFKIDGLRERVEHLVKRHGEILAAIRTRNPPS